MHAAGFAASCATPSFYGGSVDSFEGGPIWQARDGAAPDRVCGNGEAAGLR